MKSSRHNPPPVVTCLHIQGRALSERRDPSHPPDEFETIQPLEWDSWHNNPHHYKYRTTSSLSPIFTHFLSLFDIPAATKLFSGQYSTFRLPSCDFSPPISLFNSQGTFSSLLYKISSSKLLDLLLCLFSYSSVLAHFYVSILVCICLTRV